MSMEQAPLEQVAERNLLIRSLADLPEVLRRLWEEYRRQGARAAAQYTFDHLTRLATGAPPHYFSRVTPQLHLGGQYSARGWPLLRARGITAVVNLRDEFDDAEAGIAPPAYLYLPTVDNTPPLIEDLCRGIRFIREEIAGGGRVYVHCMLGVGRSATLVAAYLVHQGMTPAQAWRTIRRARPFIQPTLGQMALIESFAQVRPDCSPQFTPI